jgi:hypothetical protein
MQKQQSASRSAAQVYIKPGSVKIKLKQPPEYVFACRGPAVAQVGLHSLLPVARWAGNL